MKSAIANTIMRNSSKFIVQATTFLLIFLFLYTALSKLVVFGTFKTLLAQYPLIGSFSGLIAWLVPATEIFLCLLLFVPASRKTGLWLSAVLLGLFTLYTIYLVSFAPKLPCSCGGVIAQLSWQQHLLLNVVFLTLSAVSAYSLSKAGDHLANATGGRHQ